MTTASLPTAWFSCSLAVAAVLLTALMAPQLRANAQFVDNFDNANTGGWTFSEATSTLNESGGNPGGYLRGEFAIALLPSTETLGESVFTGNYLTRGVQSLGGDFNLLGGGTHLAGRPLSVVLHSNNGTPDNHRDDWAAFQSHAKAVPQVGDGWTSIDFEVDSDADVLPEGWSFLRWGNLSPSVGELSWHALLQDVAAVGFTFGEPSDLIFEPFAFVVAAPTTYWAAQIGIDNARIKYVPEPNSIGLVFLGSVSLLHGSRRR